MIIDLGLAKGLVIPSWLL